WRLAIQPALCARGLLPTSPLACRHWLGGIGHTISFGQRSQIFANWMLSDFSKNTKALSQFPAMKLNLPEGISHAHPVRDCIVEWKSAGDRAQCRPKRGADHGCWYGVRKWPLPRRLRIDRAAGHC